MMFRRELLMINLTTKDAKFVSELLDEMRFDKIAQCKSVYTR